MTCVIFTVSSFCGTSSGFIKRRLKMKNKWLWELLIQCFTWKSVPPFKVLSNAFIDSGPGWRAHFPLTELGLLPTAQPTQRARNGVKQTPTRFPLSLHRGAEVEKLNLWCKCVLVWAVLAIRTHGNKPSVQCVWASTGADSLAKRKPHFPQSYTAGMCLTARPKILLGRLKVNIFFLHLKKESSCYKHSGGVPAKSVSEDSLLEFSKVSLLLFEVLGKWNAGATSRGGGALAASAILSKFIPP